MATRNYYPEVINRLHLRAFYRMYREPHTIKRYLIDYPSNFLHLLAMLVRHKVASITAPRCREMTMHILFILKDFKPGGGVERVQQRLAGQFLKDGQRVEFFRHERRHAGHRAVCNVFKGGGNGIVGLLKSIVLLRRIIRREGVTHLIAAKEQANLCTWFATLGSCLQGHLQPSRGTRLRRTEDRPHQPAPALRVVPVRQRQGGDGVQRLCASPSPS